MNKEITVEVLGKSYQIKCPETEIAALQRAALFLDEKMRTLRDSGKVLSDDRIIMITALNITHQFLALESQSQDYAQTIQQKLKEIQTRVETALVENSQMELSSAE